MNIAHGFRTYREQNSLVNVFSAIQTIHNEVYSINNALQASIEYFGQTNFTPNSLITSICNNIISQSELHLSKNALLNLFSDFIYQYTYSSQEPETSSSINFFINELHNYCENIESKN